MPKDGKRAIVRCRDDEHIHPFPMLNLGGCRALHIDGHQPDAAIHYAKVCREAGIMTSLDGGGLRTNTHELLEFIDVAIVAERLCEQMDLTPEKMLDYPQEPRLQDRWRHPWARRACSGTTRPARCETMPAMPIPRERVIDTNGAGDVFHGAYVYSYLAHPGKSWREHFDFARAASTFKIQRLGNEAELADPRRHRQGQARVRGQGLRLRKGRSWGASSSPAASTWMWWRRPTAIRGSARPSPASRCSTSPAARSANQAVAASRLGARTTLIGRLGKDALRRGAENIPRRSGHRSRLCYRRRRRRIPAPRSSRSPRPTTPSSSFPAAMRWSAPTMSACVPLAKGDVAVSQFEIPLSDDCRVLPPRPRGSGDDGCSTRRRHRSFRELLALVDILVLNETELGLLADTELVGQRRSGEDPRCGAAAPGARETRLSA